MSQLHFEKISPGIFWLEIPEENLRMLCGCPEDSVKHLIKTGKIRPVQVQGVATETGPNAILLADTWVQDGEFSNLSEFPVLQMLYRQGMMVPNHPNNTGQKPLLLGSEAQLKAQMEYIFRGNYGLVSQEEMLEAGASPETAQRLMRMKLKFAFGRIKPTEELLDSQVIQDHFQPLGQSKAQIKRLSPNRFLLEYQGQTQEIDLNLQAGEHYQPSFELPSVHLGDHFFSVVHSGQGDGWDYKQPSMSSILIFQGEYYLVDAPTNIRYILQRLSISLTEVKGIFMTHCHDDHFAGLASLIHSDSRIKILATPLVMASIRKKMAALIGQDEQFLNLLFETHFLIENQWNDLDGLEILPQTSPHPVETTTLSFRLLGQSDHVYTTYRHLADIASFAVLDSFTTQDPQAPGLDPQWVEQIKAQYLEPATIKKVDVGGGMIHGMWQDFVQDESQKLVWAHRDHPPHGEGSQHGKQEPFGVIHSLALNYQDFYRRKAYHFLASHFPTLLNSHIRLLLNLPLQRFYLGEEISSMPPQEPLVRLIITGTVNRIQPSGHILPLLAGQMIGERHALKFSPSSTAHEDRFIATSEVLVLSIPALIYRHFVQSHHLTRELCQQVERRMELQKSDLFFGVSAYRLNQLLSHLQEVRLQPQEILEVNSDMERLIFMVEGEALKVHPQQGEESQKSAILKSGDHCGGAILLGRSAKPFQIKAITPCIIYCFSKESVLKIPSVVWRLFEKTQATS